MPSRRVVVLGGGAFGWSCALRLARDGAHVLLVDAGGMPSASAVAAGMLAPGSEAVLDGAGPPALLDAARDLWAAADLPPGALVREGALHLVAATDAADRAAALARVGALAEPLDGGALAAALPPGVRAADGDVGFRLPGDWRLASQPALAALEAQAHAAGVRRGRVARLSAAEASPAALGVDTVVLAAGWGAAALAGLAPEARRLSPIKGQLLRFPGAEPTTGPAVRATGAYLVPDAGGAIVGATMEPGASDLAPDPVATARLRIAAETLVPGLKGAVHEIRVGVRASTADGLPLIGPSATPGVVWAAGARRNGWLLAPLVAEVVAAYVGGRDPGPWAPLLHPRRFDPA